MKLVPSDNAHGEADAVARTPAEEGGGSGRSALRAPSLAPLLVLLACVPADPADDDDATAAPMLEAEEGRLETENAAGRRGSYYLPPRRADEPVAVLLGFHGTGGDGEQITSLFAAAAERSGFAVVAPDSRVSPGGEYTWEVGDRPGEVTPDYEHALDCLAEVEDREDFTAAPGRLLAAGHSGGASSAPYLATNEPRFEAFAVLHGGVVIGGIGDHVIRGWFSTGEDDSVRTPEHVQQQLDSMRDVAGFTDLTLRIYPGGHGVGEQERDEVIAWWLGD